MRKLWECKDWGKYIDWECRSGIRLRFEKGVDPEVKRACTEFVWWLREEYEFPIRVPIYFKASKSVKVKGIKELGAGVFWGPFDRHEEPYIQIAVGNYKELLQDRFEGDYQKAKDNALAVKLDSIAHELSHYFQWIKDHEAWCELEDRSKYERQAVYYAREIVWDYADVVDHP